jgi:hypothetical protein
LYKIYKTKLTTSECLDALSKKLVSSYYSSWGKDVFIGKVRGDKYRFNFHKAYIRNNFIKEVTGKIYSRDGETFVTVSFRSPWLSKFTFISIILFAFVGILFLETITGFPDDFIAYLVKATIGALVFSSYILIVGLIVQAVPISENRKIKLLDFLVKTLQLEDY